MTSTSVLSRGRRGAGPGESLEEPLFYMVETQILSMSPTKRDLSGRIQRERECRALRVERKNIAKRFSSVRTEEREFTLSIVSVGYNKNFIKVLMVDHQSNLSTSQT